MHKKRFDRNRVVNEKKGVPETKVKVIMSLNKKFKTKIKIRSGLSGEFLKKVGPYQRSALSPLLVCNNR